MLDFNKKIPFMSIQKKQKYILSPFLYVFKSIRNGYLAYNGLNNSFVKINKELFDFLNEAKSNKQLYELDVEIQEKLKSNFIICTEENIQTQINQKKFLRSYHTFQNEALNLTIAPTSACNFKCFYCYENGVSYKTMDDDTIEKLIDFIVRRSKKTDHKVNITWYGGEPLLAIKQINIILNKLKEKNIKIIGNSIITNGYFLNAENFSILMNNNIDIIQITLDGSNPETHNERRKNKDGCGSWDKIIENIDNILKTDHEFYISIRCNVAKDNQEEFQVLKDYLENRWDHNPKVSIHAGILRNHQDEIPKCQYFTDIESSEFLISQGVKNKNLHYLSRSIGGCSATQFNAYLVGPEGELYKCWNELGRTDRIIGNINNELEINKGLLLNYLSGPSMIDDEKCKNCCLFFVCEGGCQWSRINNHMYNKNENLCYFVKMNIEKYFEEYYELKKHQK